MATLFFTTSKITSLPSLPPPSPLHTNFSESMMEENIETAHSLITKWNPKTSSNPKDTKPISLFLTNRTEGREFLKCVKNLRRAMHYYLSENSTSPNLALAQTLMQIAMHRLEQEFYSIISAFRQNLDPDSVSSRSSNNSTTTTNNNTNKNSSINEDDDNYMVDDDDDEESSDERVNAVSAIIDLKAIAECMIMTGYGKECVKIYKVLRKSIVDEELFKIGFEKAKSSQVLKMDGVALDHKIKKWLNALKNAMTKVFQRERILCDHVFSASASIRESCFTETARDGAIMVFRFAEAVAKRRSPDRIFKLMEMHKAISDLWPEIESVFSFESTLPVRSQALSSLVKLSDSIRIIISDFQSTLQKDSSKKPVAGGGIHPLTRSTMNYVACLADYSTILSDIVCDWPPPATKSQLPESYFDSPKAQDSPSAMSAVSVRLAWVILVLLCKLDNKAELYKDVSLSYLFMANNLNLIVEKVRTTELRHLLGDEWIAKHQTKVKNYASNYEATAWFKVLSSLPAYYYSSSPPPPLDHPEMSPPPGEEDARECFRRFNYAFEEAYKKQRSWIVPDGKLRDEMKVSIARKLVNAYSEFYHENVVKLSGESKMEDLVRFVPDDLGNYLSDLFHGASSSSSSSSSLRGSSSNKRRFWSG